MPASSRRPLLGALVVVLVAAMTVFIVLTVVVSSGTSLAADAHAFKLADQLRAPWLDQAARLVTKLGLIAVVGPAVVAAAALLIRDGRRLRASALAAGAALAWIAVWITKAAIDRPRPVRPLVETAGQSFPSAHAANAVGWLALAIALGVVIPNRAGRVIASGAGAVIAVLVGLSRIYLRAHYLSDVLAGEAIATAMYAAAAIVALNRAKE